MAPAARWRVAWQALAWPTYRICRLRAGQRASAAPQAQDGRACASEDQAGTTIARRFELTRTVTYSGGQPEFWAWPAGLSSP